jgi:hypothetical protein
LDNSQIAFFNLAANKFSKVRRLTSHGGLEVINFSGKMDRILPPSGLEPLFMYSSIFISDLVANRMSVCTPHSIDKELTNI